MDIPFAAAALYRWTQQAARRDPVRPLASLDIRQTRSVLLVLTTGLGDAVLSTPVLAAVRRSLPQARITLFVRAAWAPLFSAESDIDAVLPYYGKWRRFLPTLRALRQCAPDLALILHGNDPDILPLGYLAGARHIVRVPTSGTRYGWLLSNAERSEDRQTVDGWHYIDNRLRILDSIGIPAARSSPVIHPPATAMAQAANWRQARFGDAPYWVLHPWAADAYKSWPTQQAMEFIAAAAQRWPQLRIVVTGSVRERDAAQRLACSHPLGVVAAGEFDIAGTAALISGARAVVAPDTGLLHLAAALDIPTVGLFSPTKLALVGPRAEHAAVIGLQQPLTCTPCLEKKCPYAEALCMAQFSSGQVLEALAKVMPA